MHPWISLFINRVENQEFIVQLETENQSVKIFLDTYYWIFFNFTMLNTSNFPHISIKFIEIK